MQVNKQKHQGIKEKPYFWYEAIFLDREDVEKAFKSISKDYPKFDKVPGAYHVTTEIKPDPKHEELYGSVVEVHIKGYTYGAIFDEKEGVVSHNEGFFVEVSSSDKKMQELLDSCDKIWHITGSYTVGARYTGLLDFLNAIPVDMTIEGVFGIGDSNGIIILEKKVD